MTSVPHILINGNHIDYLEFDNHLICKQYCNNKPDGCNEFHEDVENLTTVESMAGFKSSPSLLNLALAFYMSLFLSQYNYI